MNTLKSRLTLLFGGLAFVATAASTWVVSDLAVDALRKSTGQNLEEIAIQFRDKIDLDLYERYNDFKVVSAFVSPLLESGCSGLLIPDTKMGGKFTATAEVLHDKTTSYIFNRVQT